jgi:exosortase B
MDCRSGREGNSLVRQQEPSAQVVVQSVPFLFQVERMTSPAIPIPKDSNAPLPTLAVGLWLLACALFYQPTYVELFRTTWSTEDQGHGPMIVAAAAFLLWQRRFDIFKEPPKPAVGSAAFLMVVGMLLYVVGHSQSVIEFESLSQLPVLMAGLLLIQGWSSMRRAIFPILFLLFSVPMPGVLTQMLTMPLKLAVSIVASDLLYWVGYPIARVGVTLTVGQYQLLVADACSGINSLFTLEALGILYMNVMDYKGRVRNALLAIMIVPISFASNVIRVITLVLLTYHFGDEVGQGFAHEFSGLILFSVALVLTYAFDRLVLARWFDKP